MDVTTIIVVRHGESVSNVRGTFTGQMDAPLTDLGHEQARRTAEYLKDRHIDAIYSSDLIRAMQTAQPTAEMRGLSIHPDERLREICGGDWEGRNGDEIAKLYPESYALWKESVFLSTPDGGESFLQVADRMTDFLQEILKKHHGECVAIFSHALAVRTLACQWFGLPYSSVNDVPWSSNASVSEVQYHDDGSLMLVSYAYSEHQGEKKTVLSKGLA